MTPSPRARSADSGSVLSFSGAGPSAVALDRLVASRMLLQASSGGGKSWALRSLLEGTHGRVQHLVIDPEGEFSSLRERFDYLLCAAQEGDVRADPRTAGVLARRLLELGTSAVLDLYDLPLEDRREFVRRFLLELMSAPRTLWHPTLVVLDEAHVFAPERGAGESSSTEAVVSLCTQGRKRGFAAVLATQRIAKLNKNAAAELLNKLIGRTGDVDLKRAGDELGLDKAGRQRLKLLQPGQFFAYGPALSDEIRLVRTGPVITHHPQVGGLSSAPPPAPASLRAVVAQLADLNQLADQEAATVADYERQVAALKERVRQLERGTVRRPEAAGVSEATVLRRIEAATHAIEQRTQAQRKSLALAARKLSAHVAAASRSLETVVAAAAELAVLTDGSGTPSTAVAAQRAPPKPQAGGWKEHTLPAIAVPARDGDLVPAQQRILDALSALEALGVTQPAKQNVAVLSAQSARSSAFQNNLGRLRTLGLVEYPAPGCAALTPAGRAQAQRKTIASRAELHAAWEAQLPRTQMALLRELIATYPSPLSREDLAGAAAQSPTSSAFQNNLGALRSLGLVEYRPGRLVAATSLLFPPGLT